MRTVPIPVAVGVSVLAAAAGAGVSSPQAMQPDSGLRAMPAAQRPAYLAFESALNAVPTADSLRHWHEMLCSEPHIAGTEGDLRTADRIADAFRAMGLDVEKQEI